MVASIIILFVLMALVIAALLFFTIGLYTLVEKTQKDITALNALYDALEKQGAEHYANEGTLGSRIEFIESKMVKTTKKPSKEQ